MARRPSAISSCRQTASSARSSKDRMRFLRDRAVGQPQRVPAARRLRRELGDPGPRGCGVQPPAGGLVSRGQPSLRLDVRRASGRGAFEIGEIARLWCERRDRESERRELKWQEGHGASIVTKPEMSGVAWSRRSRNSSQKTTRRGATRIGSATGFRS